MRSRLSGVRLWSQTPSARCRRRASARSRTGAAASSAWRCAMARLRGSRTMCRNSFRATAAMRRMFIACTSATGCRARVALTTRATKTSSSEGLIGAHGSAGEPAIARGAARWPARSRQRHPSPARARWCRRAPSPRRLPPRPAASIASCGGLAVISRTWPRISFVLSSSGVPVGDQLAAVDQPQAVAVLGLVHVVRGDEHGHAARRRARRSGPRSGGG